LIAEKKCVAHLTGEVNHHDYRNPFLMMYACKREIVLEMINFVFPRGMQGIAFCDLPEDTMLPGEM